jgi:transglutaminase-like putative cysteine protease
MLSQLPRDSRDTLFLLVVIALVVGPQAPFLPWWCIALTAGVLLWRGTLAWRSGPLPWRGWPVLLTLLTIVLTWYTHRSLLGREAGVTLLVLLLALKTLELRARRDAYVVFFLGFFVMLTSFFNSQSLLMAVAILLGLLGLLTALVNAHMPVGKPPLLQAARTAGWMTMLGAPVMVVLFVLFPRIAPLWGIPADAASGRSGLSGSMQVGQIGHLALDDSIAMRIRFQGKVPAQRDLYFRGPVLTRFDGRNWQAQASAAAPASGMASGLRVSGEPVRYEVTLEPTARTWLLTLDAAEKAPRARDLDAHMAADLQWLSATPVSELLRYQAESYIQFRHGPPARNADVQLALSLPTGVNPRTLALALKMRSDLNGGRASTAQRVEAALQRLRTGGYSYTLDPGESTRDSADDFWFDNKQGFCEHIASAFVILLRGMDIPARIVTGYQGGELNAVDGYWVVRQSDAHAWTEVWHEGQGWIRVDPTSAVAPGRVGSLQRLQAPTGAVASALSTVFGSVSPGALVRMRAAWEALNNRWNQWVLDYGQSRQLNLLRNLGIESPQWEDLIGVLGLLLLGSALGGVAWTQWERRQTDPWLRLLERVRSRLAKEGILSANPTTPRAMSRQLAQREDAAHTSALRDWLMRLEVQRYAALDAQLARQALQQLKREFLALNWPTS